MRKAVLALVAASMAIPVSMAVPTDGAQARKHHRYKEWRGRDGRTYCRKSDGTTGLIIGAGIGALLGNQLNIGGSTTLSTVLGGAAGALIGKELAQGDLRCD